MTQERISTQEFAHMIGNALETGKTDHESIIEELSIMYYDILMSLIGKRYTYLLLFKLYFNKINTIQDDYGV